MLGTRCQGAGRKTCTYVRGRRPRSRRRRRCVACNACSAVPRSRRFFTCNACLAVPRSRRFFYLRNMLGARCHGAGRKTCTYVSGRRRRRRRRRGCVACGACSAVPRSRRFFYLRYMLGCPRSRRFFTCVTHSVPDAIVQVGKPAPTGRGDAPVAAVAVGALRAARAWLSPVAAGFLPATRARPSPVAAGFSTCGTCLVPDAMVQVGKPAPTFRGDAARCRRRRGCVACNACSAVPRSRRFFTCNACLAVPRSRRFFYLRNMLGAQCHGAGRKTCTYVSRRRRTVPPSPWVRCVRRVLGCPP